MDDLLKKIKKSSDYLVFRGVMCFAVLVLLLIQSMCIKDGDSGVFLILFSLEAAAFVVLLSLWLIRPFLEYEYRIRRIIDGYRTLEAPEAGSRIELTPASEELSHLIYRVLNSTRTVDLNKRQAQYLALQNQINPHFLYNTLDSIRSEALIAGLDSLADMTEALATFFRYTISNVENLVTIEEELDNCRTYFRIQQYRFGDRLSLDIETDEGTENCLIPKLTLQPILENSIIHGTETKIGKGNTAICIRRTDLRILIEVKDNGVGMDEDTLERLNRRLDAGVEDLSRSDKEAGGIALVNVNNRIHLLFGEEYGLHIYSLKNVGTTIEISLPAVTEERQLRKESADGA